MSTSSAALILIGVQARSNAVGCFNRRGLDGSIYDSGLAHQISLSNLAGEYASNKHHPMRSFARLAAQTKCSDHEAMAKR